MDGECSSRQVTTAAREYPPRHVPSLFGAAADPSGTRPTCFLGCVDDRAKPCAWDVNGSVIQPIYKDDEFYQHECVTESGFKYGGPSSSAAHELLSTDQLEERTGGFTMTSGLVVESRRLLRELPLCVFPWLSQES